MIKINIDSLGVALIVVAGYWGLIAAGYLFVANIESKIKKRKARKRAYGKKSKINNL